MRKEKCDLLFCTVTMKDHPFIRECMPSASNLGLCEWDHSETASCTSHQFGICNHQGASSEGQKNENHLMPRPHRA